MRLTLLGTGCPSVDVRRHGPACLVRDGGGQSETSILVDCGSGVTQRLVAADCPGRNVDALLLTHLHSDHIVDLFQLVISSWHQGRDRPWDIYGPPGTRTYVDGLMELWKPELEQRIAHEKRPSTLALEIQVFEIVPDSTLEIGDLKIDVVEVDHRPVRHAFGFVFHVDGEKLTVSGDTCRSENLIRSGAGSDVLLHEVFIHGMMPVVDGVRTAETVENVASYHTLSNEIGKIATDMGAKALVLTHFVPPRFDEGALLDEVRADFEGTVVVGEDLMTIDVGKHRIQCGDFFMEMG